MRSTRATFWASAVAVALCFGAATRLFLPYEALRLDTEAERWRAWLLTLWTGGVLGILFGLTGLLAHAAPVGLKDVVDAGSVTKAVEIRQQEGRRRGSSGFYGNFAWWLISAGAFMIALYFGAWMLVE